MKLSTIQKAFVALAIANVIWGAAAPIFKLSLQNIPPYTLAFWRFFLGALLLLLLLGRKAQLRLTSRQDLISLIGYAFCGITLNIIFFFLGLKLTYAINAPVIASAQPILTLFLALSFLREKFVWRKFWGMILGTAGILMIILEPLLEAGVDGSIVGNIFLLVATLGAVGQTIIGKNLMHRHDPLALTFWAFIIGSASFLPLALWEYSALPNLYAALDWRGYLGIVYGAVFSSAAGYGLFGWGLSKISATDASMFTYLDPIVGTVIAYFLLHEPITLLFLVGSTLIFAGIFWAEGRLHYHPVSRILHRHDAENLL